MKKKARGIILCLILLNILILSIFINSAQNLQNSISDNAEKVQDIKDKASDLSADEIKSQFLQKQRIEYFKETKAGPFFLQIDAFLAKFSQLFKILIGMEYSASWLFFLSIIFWLAMVIVIYKPAKSIFKFNHLISLALTIVFISIVAQTGVIQKFILQFQPVLKNWWTILLVSVLIVILLEIYSKYIKKVEKQEEEERKKRTERLEQKVKEIELKSKGVKNP